MSYKIPTELETENLKLRLFTNDDWCDLHEYYSDIDFMKYTIGKPLTEGESWHAMSSMVGHWELHGYGPYGIELKQTRKIIGVCGLWYPIGWPEPEIKWGLVKKYGAKVMRRKPRLQLEIWLKSICQKSH